MATFQAVNTKLAAPDAVPGRPGEETTPTTPRPGSTFFSQLPPSEDPHPEDASAKTPTRNSFGGLTGQRPLPASPFTPSNESGHPVAREGTLKRENSHRSAHSVGGSPDVDMGHDDDGRDVSDNESGDDTSRPQKKKKSQRFWCQDYPPCNLSFTRSEHLARHIRKHTGERPFQCHCSRRFSRLDNLRQHAQTVHVNEDIPDNSLAATGTRFQRQVRTERVRPAGGRARASTLGSQGGHARGHSRNLSASSIASTSSSISIAPNDARRRPAPLAMANDGTARARLSLNTMEQYNPPLMGSPGPQIVEYTDQSTGATTPTSATFSTITGSPGQYGSGFHSPASHSGRPVSWAGSVTSLADGRRLSVPSGASPYPGPPAQHHSYHNPLPSATSSTHGPSPLLASPMGLPNAESRRDSFADAEMKRRTWHVGMFQAPRPATSSLGYYQTPDAPQPQLTSQPAASQTMRLPGIDSFLNFEPAQPSFLRRAPSPMQVDRPNPRPLTYHASNGTPPARHEKRPSISFDTTIRGIDRLELESPNPQREWPYQRSPRQSYSSRPVTAPHPSYLSQQPPPNGVQPAQAGPSEPNRTSQDGPHTPSQNRRNGWYNGPIPQQPISQPARMVQRTSPEDSSSSEGVPTPSNSGMTEFHPAIVHSNGYVEKHPPGVPAPVEEQKPTSIMDRPHPLHQNTRYYNQNMASSAYPPRQEAERMQFTFGAGTGRPVANDTTRLDALVAVATGEQQAVANRS